VRTIHNGVPDVEVAPAPHSGPGTVIGTVGRLTTEKGIEDLVRALAQVPNAFLVVVGDGPQRDALSGLARDLGVADRLQITGWSAQAASWIRRFDVFALPSHLEGFPLVVVEAMLAGKPVVATDVGSVSEAVVEGETGLLVPPGSPTALADALNRLIADPAEAARLGAHARERAVRHYSADVMAEQFSSLYREIVG
jgi:glycosyltransferase involved in cell wall biosynthesis